MRIISSANAVNHTEIDLMIALKNPVPTAPFETLGTEKIYAIKNFQPSYNTKSHQKLNRRQLKYRPKYWNKIKIGHIHLREWRHKKYPYQ